ncbi:MAG: alkaline phosphatase family protein [Oscillospiraceae bacterium]|nr:alkaline phosphatase family protein [Oscillospiraceae bacterium]
MKYLLVIGDGMADNPMPQLGGKTPLQYAATPIMDKLASAGVLGSVLTVPEGMPAGTDTAVLSIFGCDPRTFYTGRAPLEAAASGISLSPGDVAYRCNMVTFEDAGGTAFEEKKIISHSAGSIEGEESDELIRELFETPVFKSAAEKAGMIVHPASSFRHIAVQKSADIDGIEMAAPHDNLGEVVGPLLPSGCDNADVLKDLMRIAHEVLDNHPINKKRRAEGKLPANGIWFWAEGTAVKLPDFTEKYGKTGGVVTAVPICHGIAALIGLEKIYVEGATGELFTNYAGKVNATLDVLRNHDFAAVHIEAPDECTHNGELYGKIQAIEWIDSRVLRPLIAGLAGIDFRMLILSDHKTLSSTRGHDGSPVPYIIYDSRYDKNTGLTYCESDAEHGKYIPVGEKLMSILFEQEVI